MPTLSLHGNEELFRLSMNQGHSAAWEGRWQEALEHYNRALGEFPDNAPTLNSLALAHLELGNLDQALELYRRASRFSPEDPLPPEKMAQIYKQTGRTDEAVMYSMEAAELHLKLRDPDKAINNWTRVIRLSPENIDAHAKLALLYEKLGRTPQAITENIAVASLQQSAGMQDEARRSIDLALSLNPKNKEAQEAFAMLQAFKPLPKPVRQSVVTGPLRMPVGMGKSSRKTAQLDFDEGPDPVEEATQKSLQTLANMLFDLSPEDAEPRKTSSLRSIARVVSDGLMARGFDEKAIVAHLSRAIELQTEKKLKESIDELTHAIDAGLDHPAAHFNLGVLLNKDGRDDAAQRSFQHAVKHADFALASRLLMGNYQRESGNEAEAVTEYLRALEIADTSVVPGDYADRLRAAYEPLIAATAQSDNEGEIKLLCENIHHLLMRPNWRAGVHEARGQLPALREGVAPSPLAEILTHANSARLVDSLAQINQISRGGHLRAAMEEAYSALEFSPGYLPLHIHMGEILLMSDRPQQAIEKLSIVARVYASRGETERSTQMYERIVSVSPLDVDARTHLIDQLISHGKLEAAARQNLELADVYYRQAQLDKARDTYEEALRLAQSAQVDSSWHVQILHQMADIDLQRLDWRNALRVFEQLRTMAPDDETARLNLVQLNLRLGQEGKANVELDNYLSSLNSRDRERDAGNFLRTLLDENPKYGLGHRRLAELYQQNGQREDAIREWNKVGELLVGSGDREGAKTAVRAILALNPPNAQRYQQFLDRLSK